MKTIETKPNLVLKMKTNRSHKKLCSFGRPTKMGAAFISLIALILMAAPALWATAPTQDIWQGGGADSNFPTAGNWVSGVPAASNNIAVFTNLGATGLPGNGAGTAGTPNVWVTNNTTIGQLWLNNSNYYNTQSSYHTIGIASGATLTISNNPANLIEPGSGDIVEVMSTAGYYTLFAGNGSSGNEDPYNTIYATILGTNATLDVICTNGLSYWSNGNIMIENGSLNGGTYSQPLNATLDLSGLDNFIGQFNHLSVGADGSSGVYYAERPRGTLYLAKTNNLQLWAVGTFPNEGSTAGIWEGLIAQNNGAGTNYQGSIYLGLTNGVYCNTGIGLGLRGVSGFIGFNTNFPQNSSTAYFRNLAGTGPQTLWSLGDRTGTASGNNQDVRGIMDFSWGSVDAQVTTLRIGISGGLSSSTCANRSLGYLSMGAGNLSVGSLVLGCQVTSGNGAAEGLITISNSATMEVNSSAQIGTLAGSTTGSFPYFGQIIITNGGTVTFANTTTITCGSSSGIATSEIDVLNGSTLAVGTVGSSAAPLTTLTVISNNTLTVDMGANPNPSTAPVQLTTLNSGGTNTLNVLGTGLIKGVIHLISYSTWNNDGTPLPVVNFVLGNTSPGVTGYLSNDVANSSIDFVVQVGTATSLIWNGQTNGVNDGLWNINTDPDWQSALKYTQPSIPGSFVQFDDTAVGTTTVNMTVTNLAPVLMLVTNNTLTYTFTGSGALAGPGKLVKDGTGLMALSNTGTNTDTGEIDINNGTLQIGTGGSGLPKSGSVVLQNNPTALLDLNNNNQSLTSVSGGGTTGGNVTLGSGTLTVTGTGNYGGVISGTGSVVKSGSGTLTLTGANLYSGGTTVSGSSILADNPSGSATGTGFVLVSSGSFQFGDGTTADGSVAAAAITNNGTLSFLPLYNFTLTNLIYGSGGLNKLIGPGSATISITNDNYFTGGTTLGQGRIQISSPNALGTGQIAVGNQTGDDTYLALAGGISVSNPVVIAAKTGGIIPPVDHIKNADGSTNTLTGSLTVTGSTVFAVGSDNGTLVVAGNFVNSQVANPGRFFLRGSGNGVFQSSFNQGAGNALELDKYDSGTWTLANSNYYTGNTYVQNGTLVVNGSISGTTYVLVNSGAELAGSGLIYSAVTNIGTLSPGGDGIVGAMTISNVLWLDPAGTLNIDVTTNAYDRVLGGNTIYLGGTLNVNAIGTITGNCVFQLFNATNYVGTFGGYNLPTLASPLVWDTSHLAVDGTLHITGGTNGAPTFSSISVSGGNVSLSGTGSFVAPYSILTTTNLALPVTNWQTIGGGVFNSGTFIFTNAVSNAAQFFLLSSPQP